MPFLAFLRLLTPRAWFAIGIAVLIAALGVQTLRLNHAKADQWDRSACVKDQSCKGIKWEAEVKTLRPALAAAQRDFATCKLNTDVQEAAIDRQNAAVTAQGAESASRLKMLSEGLEQARKGRASAEARAGDLLKHGPVGIDACARSEAAARAVVESLR